MNFASVRPGYQLFIIASLTCALAAVPRAASDVDALTYTLTPDFEKRKLQVELNWSVEGRRNSALRISPQVGPVKNVLRMLQDFRIGGANVRQNNTVFMLDHPDRANITVRYNVVPPASSFDDWQNTHLPITTGNFFHGIGNAFLLVPLPGNGVPEEFSVVMNWRLPAGYTAVCSWGTGRAVGATIKATDLRHSVYLAGKLTRKRIERDGRKITVALIDKFRFSAEEFAEMTAKIIAAQCEFMSERDFPPFVITAIPVGEPLRPGESRLQGSGLYHSFALWIAPNAPLDDAVEHLFAHELFHFWNGRILQAADPEKRAYWFVEGFTDYYALRILYESGIWDAHTYLKWINRHLRHYAHNPAKNASNREIERDYWNKRSTVGEAPYQRGLLLGIRWHHKARAARLPAGVDTLFHNLVAQARVSRKRYTNATIRSVGKRLLGNWFAAEFDRFVVNADTIPLPADALGDEFTGRTAIIHSYDAGFDQARSTNQRRILGLDRRSAAARAGLREGDRLLSWRLSGDPDVQNSLQIERAGRTLRVSYLPRGRAAQVMQFQPKSK